MQKTQAADYICELAYRRGGVVTFRNLAELEEPLPALSGGKFEAFKQTLLSEGTTDLMAVSLQTREHNFGVILFPHAERRITIHKGSQVDMQFLKGVIDKAGRPEIIIDDGSHENAHVIATFQFLFPLLADDGYYVVEDTQTSYWPGGSMTERGDSRTTMGYFKSLVDGLNWEEYYGDYEPNAYDLQIKSIAFYHNLVVIRKGDNREGSVNRQWHANSEEWQAATRERLNGRLQVSYHGRLNR